MDKKILHKGILDKLKKTNRIFDEDFNSLEKDLELELENKFIKKKDKLISLLYEKEFLQLTIKNKNY